MSKPLLFFSMAIAVAIDTFAMSMVFSQSSPIESLMAFVMHILAVLIFSHQAFKLLPHQYQEAKQDAIILIFAATLLLPVIGMIGLLIGVGPSLFRQRSVQDDLSLQHHGKLVLPEHATEHDSERGVKWGMRLTGSLQHAQDPKQRSAALIATLSLGDEMAVPLLRRAIKDPEDEVRLLAYALLNRKEKAIEKRIKERTDELNSLPIEETMWQHKALANDYWQMAQLVAPRSSTQLSFLARAKEHVQDALALDVRDGGLLFLLGRIHMQERNLDAANEAFLKATACGVSHRQIAPMLAEIAFLNGHYEAVRQHLKDVGPGLSQSNWRDALAFWEGKQLV